jgi:hypothetical protein
MMLPDLTTPLTQTVLPSNDALYGAAQVELDLLGPVVVSVPPNPDGRYYSVAVMDAALTNVAHIGPRWTGNDAGDHLVVPPGWTGQVPVGMQVVQAPTPSICLYARVLVDYSAGDLAYARQWMSRVHLTQLSTWGEADAVPDDVPTAAFEHGDISGLTDPWQYFHLGFAHLAHNPPPPAAEWMHQLLQAPELLVRPEDDAVAQAVEAGAGDAQDLMDTTLTTWPRRNGWMVPKPYLGLPGPHVLEAAAFQLFQIGSNDISESAYFFDDTDADGELLDGSGGTVYELRFTAPELPALEQGGYWSLTMYDAATNLLVPNSIDRYSTRPTRPGFVTSPDGSLTIVLAAALPPDVPEANWLPAPAAPFRLGLRAYYPGPRIRAADWVPPVVRRVR